MTSGMHFRSETPSFDPHGEAIARHAAGLPIEKEIDQDPFRNDINVQGVARREKQSETLRFNSARMDLDLAGQALMLSMSSRPSTYIDADAPKRSKRRQPRHRAES